MDATGFPAAKRYRLLGPELRAALHDRVAQLDQQVTVHAAWHTVERAHSLNYELAGFVIRAVDRATRAGTISNCHDGVFAIAVARERRAEERFGQLVAKIDERKGHNALAEVAAGRLSHL